MIYIVPTPIGNLEDITVRSKRILAASQTIICEDTRQTGKLLDLLHIRTGQRLISMLRHQSFNFSQIETVLTDYRLQIEIVNDSTPEPELSIVSDAGLPGISDPGYEITQLLIQAQLVYTVLPGACAFPPAVVASGLPAHEFTFIGFLPLKKGRQTKLKNLAAQSKTTFVMYESSHRLAKLLSELQLFFEPATKVFIGRELSKLHESYWHGEVSNLTEYPEHVKGELVIVLHNL